MTIQVMLVDDHAMVRAGIRRFLEKAENIQVIAEAGSVQEAQRLLTHQQPDVVLIDIKLPDASGIELVRRLRSQFPQLRMMMVTAYDDEPYIKAALQAGANGYLLKSAAPVDVIAAVQRIANDEAVIDPNLAIMLVEMASAEPDLEAAPQLTKRESEVLQLTASGQTNKEIGSELTISDRTVQSHLKSIFRKLQVNTRTEAVAIGLAQGLISAES